jgi:hypothetical protein
MQPLKIDVSQFGTADGNADQIKAALSLGLQELTPALIQHDGTFVIVGSGPSMPSFIEDIKQERERGRPICAINGAHDFLIENGIEPDLALTVDPRPMPQNFKLKNKRTIYLLASRVHQEVFDHLKDCKRVLWHTWSKEKECEAHANKFMVGGGTTSGLRAICVAYWMFGFKNIILYGLDSCLAEDGITKRFNGDKTGKTIDVICGDRRFLCNYAMAQQAQDFWQIYDFTPGIKIESRGNGLISAEIAELRRRGWIQ